MNQITVSNSVNSRLRRVAFEVIGKEFPAYSHLINRLLAYEVVPRSASARSYWRRLVGMLSDCVRYGWHQHVVSEFRAISFPVTFPENANRAERFLMLHAISAGVRIAADQRSGRSLLHRRDGLRVGPLGDLAPGRVEPGELPGIVDASSASHVDRWPGL